MRLKWVLLIVPAVLLAQAQTAPVLHSRGEVVKGEPQPMKGYSTLPDNASGEYEMDDNGSVVQITIEHDRLTGYITKMEHQTALTLFFERTALRGDRVSFTTKTVHRLRYAFTGTVKCGNATGTSIAGYYRLAGELTVERNGAKQIEHVNWKSTPREPIN